MANMMGMMKQAVTMQRDMKKLQKQLAKRKVEYTEKTGKVTVAVLGDMSLKSVKIDPALMEAGNLDKIEKLVAAAVNGALSEAKKQVGGEMSKMTKGTGLGDMLGSMGGM